MASFVGCASRSIGEATRGTTAERRCPRFVPIYCSFCHDLRVHSEDYYRVCDFLHGTPNFSWLNLSVPEHSPLDRDDMLQKNLRDQIRSADVLLVLW